jgi:hypothetical protein
VARNGKARGRSCGKKNIDKYCSKKKADRAHCTKRFRERFGIVYDDK